MVHYIFLYLYYLVHYFVACHSCHYDDVDHDSPALRIVAARPPYVICSRKGKINPFRSFTVVALCSIVVPTQYVRQMDMYNDRACITRKLSR